MHTPPGIVIMGGSGRMGRSLIEMTLASETLRLVGVTVRPGHEWSGKDLGEAWGGKPLGVPVTDDPIEVVARAQAVIDFTTPRATLQMSELTAQARAVHVIGTTGFTAEQIAVLKRASYHATIIQAGNMSLGVNLLTVLVEKVAKALNEEYDIEIIESHHRHKVDAPSGTALMLGEAAAAGRGQNLPDILDNGRNGLTGARQSGNIGFHAIRAGDIVGEHEVIFATEGERLSLKHIASDRALFARGALKAALWGQGKDPGYYDMRDVLGLR